MVRGGKFNEESDSDWDSISEAVIPNQESRGNLAHNQINGHESNENEEETPVKSVRPGSASAPVTNHEEPIYSEIIRPKSLDNPRIFNYKSNQEEEIDFNEENENAHDISFEEVSLETPRQDSVNKRENNPVQNLDQNNAENKAENRLINERPVRSAREVDISFSEAKIKSGKAEKTKNFKGFDNAAYEGSQHSISKDSRHFDSPFQESCHGYRCDSDSCVEKNGKSFRPEETKTHELPRPDETIEIFPFDNGCPEFYQVVEHRRKPFMENYNQKLFDSFSKLFAELFAIAGTPIIILSAFLLQFIRFIAISLLRAVFVTLISGISDGFLKPILSSVHNGFIHPLAVFLYNSVNSIKLVFTPVVDFLSILFASLTKLVAAFRLVEVRHVHNV